MFVKFSKIFQISQFPHLVNRGHENIFSCPRFTRWGNSQILNILENFVKFIVLHLVNRGHENIFSCPRFPRWGNSEIWNILEHFVKFIVLVNSIVTSGTFFTIIGRFRGSLWLLWHKSTRDSIDTLDQNTVNPARGSRNQGSGTCSAILQRVHLDQTTTISGVQCCTLLTLDVSGVAVSGGAVLQSNKCVFISFYAYLQWCLVQHLGNLPFV